MQTHLVFSRCQAQQPNAFSVSLAVQMHLLQGRWEHPGLMLPHRVWAQGSAVAADTSRLPGELSASGGSVPDPAMLHQSAQGVPGLQPVP